MSDTFRPILNLVQRSGEVLISAHGYDEMAEDDILAGEVIAGVAAAVLVIITAYQLGPKALRALRRRRRRRQ